MTTTSNHGAFPLLALPIEIRLRIYEFVLPQQIKIRTVETSRNPKYAYVAEMLTERDERPYLMLVNKLICGEVSPIFWQRVILVEVTSHSLRFRVGTAHSRILFDKAIKEKVQHLKIDETNEWQDTLARYVFVHQNLKTVHFVGDWDDSTFEDTELVGMFPEGLQQKSKPLRLISVLPRLCETLLYTRYEVSSQHIKIDFLDLCKRFSVVVTIKDWKFSCFKQVSFSDNHFGYMDYFGALTLTYQLRCRDLIVRLDHLEMIHHLDTSSSALRPALSAVDPDGEWDRFGFQRYDESEAEWFFSILMLNELEQRESLGKQSVTTCKSLTCGLCSQ